MLTIISGPHVAKKSFSACNRYAKEARNPPQIHVLRKEERPTKNAQQKLEDMVFTKVDAMWVYHLHADTLVFTARVSNNNVHRLLVDDGSVVEIIYIDAESPR